ncbi:MAG: hypothetical protein ACKKL5_03150 [Candidatus Komeilibacteria bacterium]
MDEEEKKQNQSPEVDAEALSGIQLTLGKIEEELQKVKLELAKSGLVSGKSQDFSGKLKDLQITEDDNEQIVEGVFDGQQMIGPDGKQYSIPANYISKSKLVEGDILKLKIMPDGSFIYKQIGPVARERRVGNLIKDDQGDFAVMVGQRMYKVILAAVTYFHGSEGDEAVILLPKDTESKWAAIENVIKSSSPL